MGALTAGLSQPADANALIWRYMPLWKLESLLQKRALYLSHVQRLPDDHEGSMPVAVKAAIDRYLAGCDPSSINAAVYPALRNRKWYYVSCWSMQEAESEALWRLYGEQQGRDCIAIQARYRDLISCFDWRNDAGGLVAYIDYPSFNDERVQDWDLLFLKRREYSYEKEVRVVRRHISFASPEKHLELNGTGWLTREWWESLYDQPPGILCSVNLAALIRRVVISPYSESTSLECVSELVHKSGLDVPVAWSALRNPPILG